MRTIDLSNDIGGTTALMDYIDAHPETLMDTTHIQLRHGDLFCSDITDSDLEFVKQEVENAPVVYHGWKRWCYEGCVWVMKSPKTSRVYYVSY